MTQEELYEHLKAGDDERTRLMAEQIEILRQNGAIVAGFMEMFAPKPEPIERNDDGPRDFFAAHALAGYFANPSTPHRNATDCAEYIYEMADAMVAARKKRPKDLSAQEGEGK